MPYPLKDQVAVITGGAGALGRHIVRVFLEAQSRVAVADASAQALEEVASEHSYSGELSIHETDLLGEKGVENLVHDVVGARGRIDVLVCALGGFLCCPSVAETSEADWDKMMHMNVKSTFFAAKYAFPVMQKQKYGRIITIGARPALTGAGGMAAYAASKAGTVNLTQSLAQEGAPFNITANCVLPSIIDTPANRAAMPDAKFEDWVSPEKLARTILFFASPDSTATSGAALPVYGAS